MDKYVKILDNFVSTSNYTATLSVWRRQLLDAGAIFEFKEFQKELWFMTFGAKVEKTTNTSQILCQPQPTGRQNDASTNYVSK
jgi:hypothetical protein